MTDDHIDVDRSAEADGRCVEIDTGFYRVQVWGDPDDSLKEVREEAWAVANKAKEDAAEMDDRIDDDGRQYR